MSETEIDLADLIRRLQDAAYATRELDIRIATWCFWNGNIAGVNYDPELWLASNGSFTRSVDTAMKLLPPRLHVRLSYWGDYCFQVEDVWFYQPGHELEMVVSERQDPDSGITAPPAIAWCIAALKGHEFLARNVPQDASRAIVG